MLWCIFTVSKPSRLSKVFNKFSCLLLFPLIAVSYFILQRPKPPLPQLAILEKDMGSDVLVKEPFFTSMVIPQLDFLKTAHSATLEVLPSGNLIALWFAGTTEGHPDVQIWQSKFDGAQWSMAQAVISPKIITQATSSFIKCVGNPVIYLSKDRTLHLFVVSVSLGGWSGSRLNHFISTDEGDSWNSGKQLILSPLLNISTLARTRAISLEDGGFYLPAYREIIRTSPVLIRFDKNGQFTEQIFPKSAGFLLQPAILTLGRDHAYMYLRNKNTKDNVLYFQESLDGGMTWQAALPTNLINQDTSLAVHMVDENQFLMVYNPRERNSLAIALSNDGIHWEQKYVLESSSKGLFSYPAIQAHGDVIDLLYTWESKGIKHVRFNLAWLYR